MDELTLHIYATARRYILLAAGIITGELPVSLAGIAMLIVYMHQDKKNSSDFVIEI